MQEPNMNSPTPFSFKGCGLFGKIDLPSLQNKGFRYELPVVSFTYDIQIAHGIANISVRQVYRNLSLKFVEVQYSYPVCPKACLYRFVADFRETRVEGVVKEKEKALEEYKEAVKEGEKSAYGRYSSEGEIFSLFVGNVPPKENVAISISYLQELELVTGALYSLKILGETFPTYIKQNRKMLEGGFRDEEASKQGRFYWDFNISINATREVIFYESPTHPLKLVSSNDAKTEIGLTLAYPKDFKEDFVFTYRTAGFELPTYLLGTTDSSSSAMVSFVPKFCSLSDASKQTVLEPDMENAKGQFVFFLDRSGSMQGDKLTKATEALILFVKSLPKNSYFNVVSFGDTFERMFKESQKYTNSSVKSALKAISKMKADMQGTAIYQPLQDELLRKPKKDYQKHIFLLTDGEVNDTQSVIKLVQQNTVHSRVHTIGIGVQASQALIKGCAAKGKGYHSFINTDEQNPSVKIISMLSDALLPIANNMKLKYDNDCIDSIIPNPANIPFLLKNKFINFYVNFKHKLDKPEVIEFQYEDSLSKKQYSASVTIDPSSKNLSFINKMGYYTKIHLMEQCQQLNPDYVDLDAHMYYVKDSKIIKERIIEESIKHQVLSSQTAFICVEKGIKDNKYQEFKDIGNLKIKFGQKKHEYFEDFSSRPSPKYATAMPRLNACSKHHKSSGFSNPFSGFFSKISDFFSSSKEDSHSSVATKATKIYIKGIDMNELIQNQDIEGFWSDSDWIGKLFTKDLMKVVKKQKEKIAITTYLIARWIEVNCKDNQQYMLIIKKAYTFCKSNANNFQSYPQLYDNYIPTK